MRIIGTTIRRATGLVLAGTCLLACGGMTSETEPQDASPHAGGQANLPSIALAEAFPKITFTRPILLTHDGVSSDHVYVVEQPGRILRIENRSDVSEAPVFVDFRERVYTRHNEEGLLSLAFHPRFAENRTFFVFYSANEPRRGVLARMMTRSDDPTNADPASLTPILEIEQPWGNHNGADIRFGPDGYLYLSLGDGGAANDPLGSGQDLSTLLGTIIRIDIDRTEGDLAYAIPPDNPFVGREDARSEIWAYGLRNVWRMSFDSDGRLWAGDVGQNRWEEIDLIVPGGNYGWNLREGTHPFKSGKPDGELIDPIVEHPRNEAWSITGGHVYRGTHESLRGAYVYADYVTRRIWGLRYADGAVVAHRELIQPQSSAHVASFGEDAAGELYICAFDKIDKSAGRIYRIVAP